MNVYQFAGCHGGEYLNYGLLSITVYLLDQLNAHNIHIYCLCNSDMFRHLRRHPQGARNASCQKTSHLFIVLQLQPGLPSNCGTMNKWLVF
jgi:hypothetical protein